MDFQIPITIPPFKNPIRLGDRIFLIGSCFTEHIGERLKELKFPCIQNPHGILFDPMSVSNSLLSYIHEREYTEKDLFLMNEVWQSWDHHGRFSSIDLEKSLKQINDSRKSATEFLRKSNWLIITLGSSFSYRLSDTGRAVANCHRAPAQMFEKYLMTSEETYQVILSSLEQVKKNNPNIKVILTISPVRHIRDGVVANNRSKARLIEAVHRLIEEKEWVEYFPAYDLVIDILRDYRFYDVDMVHPNYQATRYVMERFMETCLDSSDKPVLEEIQQIAIARKHKPTHPGTRAHSKFLKSNVDKLTQLSKRYPGLDFEDEIDFFNKQSV